MFSTQPIANLAFYLFRYSSNPESLVDHFKMLGKRHRLKGTIIVAEEGLNFMLAGFAEDCQAFIDTIRVEGFLDDVEVKISYSDEVPFNKLVVKLKPEIVTMGVEGVEAYCRTGIQLPPQQLRDWIRNGEQMVLIDTRNDYEYKLGTFVGALNPKTRCFHEFPEWVNEHRDLLETKKIVMFCTGGIRCEKATSWMIDQGFGELYQLEGGILNYFLEIPDAELDWKGDLFVFDQRVAIDTKNRITDAKLCHECGLPVKPSAGLVHNHEERALC